MKKKIAKGGSQYGKQSFPRLDESPKKKTVDKRVNDFLVKYTRAKANGVSSPKSKEYAFKKISTLKKIYK